MTAKIPETAWAKLDGPQLSSEALTARLAVPDVSDRVYCAVDPAKHRHFLVALRPGNPSFRERRSRGITVQTRELSVAGEQAASYIDLECEDPSGVAAFDIVGSEICDAVGTGGMAPGEAVRVVLSRWRRFWGQFPEHVLSRDAQLGLLAELWFLSRWLIPKIGAQAALDRWKGPGGARHDFAWPGGAVEVKATTSARGRIHHINGIDQLAPPDDGRLMLFSLKLRENAGPGETLVSLVNSIREHLSGQVSVIDLFEDGLAKAGFSPAHEDEYSKNVFQFVDERLYDVRDEFPRLVVSQLLSGLPSGVQGVEYAIDLTGFDRFSLATEPSQFKVN